MNIKTALKNGEGYYETEQVLFCIHTLSSRTVTFPNLTAFLFLLASSDDLGVPTHEQVSHKTSEALSYGKGLGV